MHRPHSPHAPKHGWLLWLLGLLVCLLSLSFFFRQQIQNDFTILGTERYDGVIAISLMEHWFGVFRGWTNWWQPAYFYPYAKTISYNDGYFLYGVFHSIFRAFGLDPLLASECVNITVKTIGFLGFVVAARRIFQLPVGWAIFGATLFTCLNASYVRMIHAQLLSVAFLPVLGVLVYESWRALVDGKTRRLLGYGCGAALFFGMWLMTSVYMAWYFVLFSSALAGIGYFISSKAERGVLKLAIRRQLPALSVVAMVALLATAPFIWGYMLGNKGPRNWGEVRMYLPSILDTFNLGPDNWIFGSLIKRVREGCKACDVGYGELEVGFGPLLVVLGMLGVASAFRCKGDRTGRVAIITVVGLATVVIWLLTLRVGKFSLWIFVYHLWPGASGLRVVARVFLFLSAPLIGVAVWYLAQQSGRFMKPAALVLALCLLLEQVNLGTTVSLDRQQQLARLAVPPPPAGCKAFFTTESPDTSPDLNAPFTESSFAHNIDAMLIAALNGIPTVNGHASFVPKDWDFATPLRPDYVQRVERYRDKHHVEGLCRLDLVNKAWSTDLRSPRLANFLFRLQFSDPASAAMGKLSGFDAPEQFGRWSISKDAAIRYKVTQAGASPRLLRLTIATAMSTTGHSQKAVIRINGGPAQQFLFTGMGRRVIDIALPQQSPSEGEVTLLLPDAATPRQLGVNNDERTLALAVESFELL